MDLKFALSGQYHGGLRMLADCVEKCPEELWLAARPCMDEERKIDRAFWRIAFHTVYFTHLYLAQDENAFEPWPARRQGIYDGMWREPWDLEPYELPSDAQPQTKSEIIDYIQFVDSRVDRIVDSLNLAAEGTGFAWYPDMSKLSHELMNLRHLQGHVGQLSELLMARNIDVVWATT